jgi:rhomboid protease GluP
MPEQPEPEIIPPQHSSPAEPASRPSRPARSEWNPLSAPGTYLLLAINIGVFLWMILHGVSYTSPTVGQLVHFGANSTYLVVAQGEWYRLLTATFVHIGIIHIAANMWCLWNLGLLGEPLLGPWGVIAVYVLTGVAGNMLSIAWDILGALYTHQPIGVTVGAGASGAVFGIAGILIVLLSNKRLPIPWEELRRLRTSVLRFAGINLLIGASTTLPIISDHIRIDNSAHIGGFLSGLALGPALLPRMTSGRTSYLNRQKLTFAAAAFILSLFGYWIANLK